MATLTPQQRAVVERVASRLRGMRRLLFVTGAGLSADAGLPTYRGVGGLYEGAADEAGVTIEEALSGDMLARDPACCWRHIFVIEQACRGARPSRGHTVIAELQASYEVWVLTQNVDGLHRAAGSRHIIDIHGDVRDLLCTSCDYARRVDNYAGLACPPHCPQCGAVLRPDVVLFGEALSLTKLAVLRQQLARGFDAVFSIGTTSVFGYIAEPIVRARQRGALTVEINPGPSGVTDLVDEKLDCSAAAALDALASVL